MRLKELVSQSSTYMIAFLLINFTINNSIKITIKDSKKDKLTIFDSLQKSKIFSIIDLSVV